MAWRGRGGLSKESPPRPLQFLQPLPFDAGPKLAADADVPPSAPVLVERGEKLGLGDVDFGRRGGKGGLSTEKPARLGLGFFERVAPCNGLADVEARNQQHTSRRIRKQIKARRGKGERRADGVGDRAKHRIAERLHRKPQSVPEQRSHRLGGAAHKHGAGRANGAFLKQGRQRVHGTAVHLIEQRPHGGGDAGTGAIQNLLREGLCAQPVGCGKGFHTRA